MLIIICGLPGSGKSTLARALARKTGAMHLSSDRIRREMFPRPGYSEEEKQAVYGELMRRTEDALRGGRSAVVDATFYRKRQREDFTLIAERAGAKWRLILCTIEEGEAKKRLSRRRPGNVSDADYAVYLKLKGAFERIEGEHLELDTMLPLRERIRRVTEYLG
ncbi:MAG TPA: ATP-binding protein [Candidatus Bilamarchaeum sp.]|nr:ATP-binding protein [Candidatus Bilamarchaeum sp.]